MDLAVGFSFGSSFSGVGAGVGVVDHADHRDDVEPAVRSEYYRLDGKAGTLQDDYESAEDTCVTALNGVRPETMDGASPGAFNASELATSAGRGLFFGTVAGVAGQTFVVRTKRHPTHARTATPSKRTHLSLFGRHVGYVEPLGFMARHPRHEWSALRTSSADTGRHRGQWSLSSECRPGRGEATAVRHQVQLDSNPAGRGDLGRISGAVLDSLPAVGEVRGLQRPGPTTTGGVDARTVGTSTGVRTVGRALGTAGTVLSAGITFSEEREIYPHGEGSRLVGAPLTIGVPTVLLDWCGLRADWFADLEASGPAEYSGGFNSRAEVGGTDWTVDSGGAVMEGILAGPGTRWCVSLADGREQPTWVQPDRRGPS